MIVEVGVTFFTGLWSTLGPGIVAAVIIVLWDLIRIYVQSKWLVQKLNQQSSCPHCQKLNKKIEAIAKHMGVENEDEDAGHSSSY